jgi:hypothetical protein
LCACIFSKIATLGLCAAWGDFLVCNKCDNFYKERARGPGGAAGEPEKEDSLAELAHLMNPKQVCASGICFLLPWTLIFKRVRTFARKGAASYESQLL